MNEFCLSWFPNVLVLLLIVISNYLTILQIVNLRKTSHNLFLFGIFLLFWYIIINLMLLLSFLSLSKNDPGSLEFLGCQIEAPDDSSFQRYCYKCRVKRWKPPRAHHCSNCKKCIFKMDHHCALVNNCIGYSNQKIYILFLFYIICSSFTSTLVSIIFFKYNFTWGLEELNLNLSFILINLIINLVVFLCSITFFTDQLDCISTNSSLVELIINKRGRNQSFINNFESIFGKNKYLWWVPLRHVSIPEFAENLYDIQPSVNSIHSEIRPADESHSDEYGLYLSKYYKHFSKRKEI